MRRILSFALILILLPVLAHAQDVNGIDLLLARYQAETAKWTGPLQTFMYGTFGALGTLDLIWFVGYRTLMSRGTLVDFVYAMVGELVFLGFFGWLLTTFNVTAPLVIQGFRYAAQQAGGTPVSPNGIFAQGMQIASAVIHQMSIVQPANSLGLLLCGVIVVLCFAWIVTSIVLALVESYFIVSAGQIMLMFGGSHFTYDKAIALLWQVVGVGLKIYILQLIAAVGTAFINNWVNTPAPLTLDNILIEIGQVIILAGITAGIPHIFERMATYNGTSGAGGLVAAGGALIAAGTVMGRAISSSITAAAGGSTAVGAASRLAITQQNANTGPGSTSSRAAAIVGSTVSNLASAKATDIYRGLSGQRSNLGQPSWRMAADLKERQRLLSENNNTP